jgi:hypothetical protein
MGQVLPKLIAEVAVPETAKDLVMVTATAMVSVRLPELCK